MLPSLIEMGLLHSKVKKKWRTFNYYMAHWSQKKANEVR